MKKKIQFLFFHGIFSILISSAAFAQFRVVGYLPTWSGFPNSINNIDLTKLTHIDIAFSNPNSSGTLSGNSANIAVVVSKAHAKNVKVLMSIGGWGAPGSTYKTIITNDQTGFVNKIVKFTIDNNLDGIDVDIEGDILDGKILTAAQYESFVTELGIALHSKNKLMTAALANWFGSYVTNTAASKFDFIGIMSYDAAQPPGNPAQHSTYSMAVSDFKYWNGTKGVPGSKLLIGVPFYGYCWGTYNQDNGQSMKYCPIVTKYAGAENNDQVGSGSNVIYYNGIPTIKKKTTYALQNAGGVMIWELTGDCNNSKSLLVAIDEAKKITTLPDDMQFADFKLQVFPNPVADHANIQFDLPEKGSVNLALYDIEGRIVWQVAEGIFEQRSYEFNIPMSHLNSGIYILKLSTNEGTLVRKISR
jgi:chitinase